MKRHRTIYRKPFQEDQLTGPLLTMVVLLMIEPLNQLLPYAEFSPMPFYLTMVVFSAFMGGTRTALFSSALGGAYCISFYWLHGDINLLWAGEDLYNVIQLIASVTAISLLAGRLKEKTVRPFHRALSAGERALRVKTIDLMKSNADLENFLHMASHDLKSPLLNMEGLIRILHEEVGIERNEEVSSVLRQMEKTMFSMHQTLHTLQAHMQSAPLQPQEQEDCNFEDLVDEIKNSISIMIAESDARIETDFKQLPEWLFIRGKLHSILYNLLTNAIKYRDGSRKPQVRISTEKQDDYCVLTVKDNGLGIDLEKERENLFRIFKRFHNHVEGTGVGLYLVKQIAESTGGHVEVESTPGQGTTFRVFLRPAKVRYMQDDQSQDNHGQDEAIAV